MSDCYRVWAKLRRERLVNVDLNVNCGKRENMVRGRGEKVVVSSCLSSVSGRWEEKGFLIVKYMQRVERKAVGDCWKESEQERGGKGTTMITTFNWYFCFIGVHNVEFVLSGILKQQLDFYRYPFCLWRNIVIIFIWKFVECVISLLACDLSHP